MKKIYKRIISIALVVAIVVGIIISPLGKMLNLTQTALAYGSKGQKNIEYDYINKKYSHWTSSGKQTTTLSGEYGTVSKNNWNIYQYSNGTVLYGNAHVIDLVSSNGDIAVEGGGTHSGTTFTIQLDSGSNFLSQWTTGLDGDLDDKKGIYYAVCNTPGANTLETGTHPYQQNMGNPAKGGNDRYRIGYKAELKKTGNEYTWTIIVGWYYCSDVDSNGRGIMSSSATLVEPYTYVNGFKTNVQTAKFTVKYTDINITASKRYQTLDGNRAYYALPWLYTEKNAKYELQLSDGTKLCTGTTDLSGKIKWSGLTAAANNKYIKIDPNDSHNLFMPRQTKNNTWTLKLVETTPPEGYTKKNTTQTVVFNSNLKIECKLYDGDSSGESTTDIQNSPLFDYIKASRIRLAKHAGDYTMSDFNGAQFELYYTPYNVNNLTAGTTITTNEKAGTRTVRIKSGKAAGNPASQGDGYYYDDIIYKIGTFEIKNGQITASANDIYWHYTTSINATTQNNAATNGGTISQDVKISSYSHGAFMSEDGTRILANADDLSKRIKFTATVNSNNGEQYFTSLPLGKFMLVEVKAPTKDGIGLSTETYYTWVNSYANSTWDNYYGNDHIVEHIFNINETVEDTYSLTVTKNYEQLNNVDAFYLFAANGIYQRAGAKYDLRLNNSSGTLIAQGTTNANGKVKWNSILSGEYKLSKDGLTISKIPANTKFYLQETQSPYGYKKASNQTINIVDSDVNVTTGAALDEEPIEIEFTMDKSVSGDPSKTIANGDFDGAEFQVYYTPYASGVLTKGGLEVTTDTENRTRTVKISNTYTSPVTVNGTANTAVTADKFIYNVGSFKIENGQVKAYGNTVNFSLPNPIKDATTTGYSTGTFKVKTSGNKFIHMPIGKYVIIETKAPDNDEIKLSEATWHIIETLNNKTTRENYTTNTQTKNTSTYVQWHVVENIIIDNPTINVVEKSDYTPISLSLGKQPEDENCAVGSMEGTVYYIYYNKNGNPNTTIGNYTRNSDGTSTRKVTPGANTSKVGEFTIDSMDVGIVTGNFFVENEMPEVLNGRQPEELLNIPTFYGMEGYYRIIEVQAPKNYGFDDSISSKVYHLTKNSTANESITSEEPSPSDPLAISIKKEPENLEALAAWKSKTGEDFDLSGIKSLNESYDGARDGTEFTVKFYKGYTSWGTSGLSAGISNGTITPDIELVYKVINGIIDFSDDTYFDRAIVGEPIYNNLDEIVFPIGILTIEESQAAHDYSVKNNKWTDEQGNVYPAKADHFANGVGLVVKYSQDPDDIYACKKEFMTGDSTNPWIKADLISTSVSGIPEFTVINPTHKADFTIIKTVNGAEMNGGAEINNEPLADVQFTAYYFYNVANELKALDSNNDETSDWDEFILALSENNQSEYQSILDKYEAKFTFTTDSNGKYNSGSVPTGCYVIVEESCDANRGLALAKPIVIELNKNDSKSETIENLIPEIHTTQWDKELSTKEQKTHMSNLDSNVYVMDTIRYNNLRPNTEYTFKSIIMLLDDQNNATILRKADNDKNSIQKRVRFTTDSTGSGTVDMEFNSFDALHLKDADGNDITASGRKFVVYEFLFEGNQTSTALTGDIINQLITNTGNVDYAVRTKYGYVGHWSNTDTSQIGWFPKFSTTEHDRFTLTNISSKPENNWLFLEDLLTYELLDRNMTYTVFLSVTSYDDMLLATKKYTLVPDTTGNGSELLDDITFYVDDINSLDKFYISELICKGELNSVSEITDENIVGTHDAKIESQTGYIAYIGTNASASTANGKTNSNGIYEAYAAKDVTLTDIVHAHNMMGLSVSITCTYKYVTGTHAGETVKDAKGNDLTTTKTYTFNSNKVDEDVSVVIEHKDLSNLKSETIVAYETITYKNSDNKDVIIAKEHKDDSLTQSVAFVGIPVKFNKVDQRGNAVSGAKLEIRPDSLDKDSIVSWTTTNTSKEVELIEGKYYLVETQAPDGYALAEPIEFEVKGGKIIVNGTEQTELTITMIDTHLTELPTAGGIGTLWFTLSGLILMLAAVLFKKKYIA